MFQVPSCPKHPSSSASLLCLDSKAERACSACLLDEHCCGKHRQSVVTLAALQAQMTATAQRLESTERAAFERHEKVSQVINQLRENLQRDDDQMVKRIVNCLERENQEYKETAVSVESLSKKLMVLRNMLEYFGNLHEHGLFQLKMELASEKGLRKFTKKERDFAALSRKGTHSEFVRISQELAKAQGMLDELTQNGFITRLQQAISNWSQGSRPASRGRSREQSVSSRNGTLSSIASSLS